VGGREGGGGGGRGLHEGTVKMEKKVCDMIRDSTWRGM